MQYARSTLISSAPAVSTSQYTAGDVVGGVQDLGSKAAGPYRYAVLLSLLVVEDGTQAPELEILFFNAEPAGVAADNAALTLTDADALKLVGRVQVASADYETVGGKAIAQVKPGIVLQGKKDTDDSLLGKLWAVAVAVGTPTLANAAALRFGYGLLQD